MLNLNPITASLLLGWHKLIVESECRSQLVLIITHTHAHTQTFTSFDSFTVLIHHKPSEVPLCLLESVTVLGHTGTSLLIVIAAINCG